MRARSLVFFSGNDNTDSLNVLFIYILGYLRLDYKHCLKFISNVWDSFCMHFDGGKLSGLLTEARQLN